jgi:hypothetical protein
MSQVKKNSPVLKKASPKKVTPKKATPKKVKKATPKKVAAPGPKAVKKVPKKAVKKSGVKTPKKRVPKRVSNAPKRPIGPFFIYMKENREHIKRDHPEATFTEIPKIGAAEWAALKPAVSAKYVALAEKDRLRYANEMASYVPDPEDKKKKRKKKDANAPKRPSTAYIMYVKSRLDQVQKAHPDYKMTEVMTALGAEWRGLDARTKRPYEELATKDKTRYNNEMAKYTPK